MPSTIDNIVEVVGKLVEMKDELEKPKKELRVKISALFDQIGECLKRMVAKLKNDQAPQEICAELDTYAVGIAVLIAPVAGQTEAIEISDKLREASRAEELVSGLKDISNREDEIAKIDRVANELSTLSSTLQATS